MQNQDIPLQLKHTINETYTKTFHPQTEATNSTARNSKGGRGGTQSQLHTLHTISYENQLKALQERKKSETVYFFQIVLHKMSRNDDVYAQEYLEKTTRETETLLALCGNSW